MTFARKMQKVYPTKTTDGACENIRVEIEEWSLAGKKKGAENRRRRLLATHLATDGYSFVFSLGVPYSQ